MGDKIFTLDYGLPNNFGEKIIALDADIQEAKQHTKQ